MNETCSVIIPVESYLISGIVNTNHLVKNKFFKSLKIGTKSVSHQIDYDPAKIISK